MTVLIDRGMDVSFLSYKGIPISWRSVTRETSAVFYESKGLEWLRTFYGGLLNTCGLSNIGMPCVDNGEELGVHGRISNLPAERVCADGSWFGDNYEMWVHGRVREAKVYGNKLELSRKIKTWMDLPKIVIEDAVTNLGAEQSPLMILYHINIGYPIVDIDSELLIQKVKTIPRDENSRRSLNEFNKFSEPIRGFKEQVFFHDIEADNNGNCNIALVNRKFNNGKGIGISLSFNKNNLPYLIQWRQIGFGEYVCGLEPANSFTRGRKIERENNNLRFIEPSQKFDFRIETNILTSNEDIVRFEDNYCKK